MVVHHILTAFIGLHYHRSSSPFQSHTVFMWIFVFAVFTNYGAALFCARTWLKDATYSKIFNTVGHISASLFFGCFTYPCTLKFLGTGFLMWLETFSTIFSAVQFKFQTFGIAILEKTTKELQTLDLISTLGIEYCDHLWYNFQ